MKAGWKTNTLEDCLERFRVPAKIQRKQFREAGAFPIVSQEADFVNGYWDESEDVCVLDRPVVIFGDHTQVLKYVDFDFVVGADGVKVLAPKPFIDAKYLYYFVMANRAPSLGYARHYRHVKELAVSYPDSEEQQRIVAVLDEAFEGLARARTHAEANLQNARELFERSASNLLSSRTNEHEMVELQSVANLDRGHNPPKKDFIYEPREGYVRFYQIRDRKSDDYKVYVPETKKLHRVAPDEILMSAYRHIGEVFRGADGAFNVALCKLSSGSEDRLLNDYLYSIIPTDFVKGELLRHSERSLIPSMSIKHLQTIKIPLPSIAEQKKIVDSLADLTEKFGNLEADYTAKLQDLDDLRQSLLQKAFAGELT